MDISYRILKYLKLSLTVWNSLSIDPFLILSQCLLSINSTHKIKGSRIKNINKINSIRYNSLKI